MSKRIVPQLAKDLIAARRSIENPANWCRGDLFNDYGQVCSWGAVSDVTGWLGDGDRPALQALSDAAIALSLFTAGGICPNQVVVHVNDALGHAAVLHMFDHAISTVIRQANAG